MCEGNIAEKCQVQLSLLITRWRQTFGQIKYRTGVPKLGYMYPWRYICLYEGVHLLYSATN